MTDQSRSSLLDLALVFLRLGTTAFGGPAAHVAMMRAEFVDRRGWIAESEFVDLLGAANLMPGPSSTELAIFLGYRRAGWAGLALAGVCFILPAAVMVGVIAWTYRRFGHLPQASGLLYGIKPVIIAVVAAAIWPLASTALKSRPGMAVAAVALILAFLIAAPLPLLLGAGTLLAVREWLTAGPARRPRTLALLGAGIAALVALPALLAILTPSIGAPSPARLFTTFARIGSSVYGSGYVLLAFLGADLVARTHWLTSQQLLDAVAVGQFTPGPVFTTATFIGEFLGGWRGAVAATCGIFAPAFVFVAAAGPLLRRVRQSKVAGAFLDGINAGAVALMIHVTIELARDALVDIATAILAALAAAMLLRFKINAAWLVLGGAVVGLVLRH